MTVLAAFLLQITLHMPHLLVFSILMAFPQRQEPHHHCWTRTMVHTSFQPRQCFKSRRKLFSCACFCLQRGKQGTSCLQPRGWALGDPLSRKLQNICNSLFQSTWQGMVKCQCFHKTAVIWTWSEPASWQLFAAMALSFGWSIFKACETFAIPFSTSVARRGQMPIILHENTHRLIVIRASFPPATEATQISNLCFWLLAPGQNVFWTASLLLHTSHSPWLQTHGRVPTRVDQDFFLICQVPSKEMVSLCGLFRKHLISRFPKPTWTHY